eukprot:4197463-Pyramimonas_sp.AAC.2
MDGGAGRRGVACALAAIRTGTAQKQNEAIDEVPPLHVDRIPFSHPAKEPLRNGSNPPDLSDRREGRGCRTSVASSVASSPYFVDAISQKGDCGFRLLYSTVLHCTPLCSP